jgi:hypothetical protein
MGRSNPTPRKFTPKNPEKYLGDVTNIWARSSWENRIMHWLDSNPSIISWASEECVVPYVDPADGRRRRYFPDFIVKSKSPDGKIKTIMIEVKPKSQVAEPKVRKRVTKQYINEVYTYAVNQAKWKAAQEYCLDRGWTFQIITEDDLGMNK